MKSKFFLLQGETAGAEKQMGRGYFRKEEDSYNRKNREGRRKRGSREKENPREVREESEE